LIIWKSSKEEEEEKAQEGATVDADSVLERKIWTIEVSRPGGTRESIGNEQIWAIRSCSYNR
jgi:hypothetical protein